MKKNRQPKLSVSKEKLRNLDRKELAPVAGGFVGPCLRSALFDVPTM
jgi:hypothetical protein